MSGGRDSEVSPVERKASRQADQPIQQYPLFMAGTCRQDVFLDVNTRAPITCCQRIRGVECRLARRRILLVDLNEFFDLGRLYEESMITTTAPPIKSRRQRGQQASHGGFRRLVSSATFSSSSPTNQWCGFEISTRIDQAVSDKQTAKGDPREYQRVYHTSVLLRG
jgi:hypothetical protein